MIPAYSVVVGAFFSKPYSFYNALLIVCMPRLRSGLCKLIYSKTSDLLLMFVIPIRTLPTVLGIGGIILQKSDLSVNSNKQT